MFERHIIIDGVPTNIVTFGQCVVNCPKDLKEITICVTGNPGLPGFYKEFCGALYKRLEKKIPIWCIGHKGHEEITLRHRNVPPLDGNEEEYSLNAQVLHKMNFINTYVPDGTKIHLIGHSIGAWMVLEMLKSPFLRKRVVQCYLLFPTIERLAVSPKGWLFNNIILPFSPILKVLVQCFNKLSVSKRSRLIQWYFWLKGIPYYYVDTVLKFLTPPVIEKVLFLAKNEMKIVRELNHEVIKECFPLLQLYYGANDEWVPTKYFEDLKQKYPKINAVMDTEKIDHSFVLNNSIEMADIVGQFIKTYSNLFYY